MKNAIILSKGNNNGITHVYQRKRKGLKIYDF